MQLIPKAGELKDYQFIFDYLGKPYGLYLGILTDEFAEPWADWFARRGNQ